MTLITLEFASDSLKFNTTVKILLPKNTTDKKFKTLYLLHGYFGNHTDWTRLSSIERYLEKYNIAAVMPDANNSYYANMVYGQRYFDYIASELPNYLESILPLSNLKEDKYIAGLSMGGYGALKVALTYPEKYHKVASISGAVDIEYIVKMDEDADRKRQMIASFGSDLNVTNSENDLFFLAKSLKSPLDIYLNCGLQDFLLDSNKKFASYLDSLNIAHTIEYYEGTHDWLYWDREIINVLNFFFSQ